MTSNQKVSYSLCDKTQTLTLTVLSHRALSIVLNQQLSDSHIFGQSFSFNHSLQLCKAQSERETKIQLASETSFYYRELFLPFSLASI